MKRWVLHLVAFFLVFSVEVHVRAETAQFHLAHDPVSLPRGCAEKFDVGCAVRTEESEKLVVNFHGSKLILSEHTAVLHSSENEIRLVEGAAWARPGKGEHVTVRTEYGMATGTEDFWVERLSDRMTVSAIGGDVEMSGIGSPEPLIVAPALENFVGRIGKDGRASTGLPTPIDSEKQINRWARLYDGKKADFEKELAVFKEVWIHATVAASETHQILYERKVAALQNEADQRRAARQKVEARDRAVREKFRAKFLSGE